MILPLVITSLILLVGLFLDAKSTVGFLKAKTGVEGDPVAVWLFGSNTPTPKRVWITCSLLYTAALFCAISAVHLWPSCEWLVCTVQVVESIGHFIAAYKNWHF